MSKWIVTPGYLQKMQLKKILVLSTQLVTQQYSFRFYHQFRVPVKSRDKFFKCVSPGFLGLVLSWSSSIFINPQWWYFITMDTMTLAQILVESAIKRTIHQNLLKGLLKDTKTFIHYSGSWSAYTGSIIKTFLTTITRAGN